MFVPLSVLDTGMAHHEQVHPTIIEPAAAHTRLRIIDGLAGINAHGFAFAHRDSDTEDVARAGANKLLAVLPGPAARDRIAGAVAPDERLRPA
jgi:hypothetical protein